MWVKDLEAMRCFYEKYFNAKSGEKYHNANKNFQSYFLAFDSGCRLELMNKPGIAAVAKGYDMQCFGLIHLAISVGNKETVDALTTRLKNDGYTIAGHPRITGDGYYESVVLDPENNIIEITE